MINLRTGLCLFFAFVFICSCTRDVGRNGHVIHNAVKDVDGNSYDAVRIGKQVWMKSNLRTTRFRDGSIIPKGEINSHSCTEPYYYKYPLQIVPDYDEKTHGLYYNWSTVNDNHGLCPKGWSVPTSEDWDELADYVGGKYEYLCDGRLYRNYAKSLASTTGWISDGWTNNENCSLWAEPDKNNATGFSAYPAGYWNCWNREYEYFEDVDDFYRQFDEAIGISAYFWSSDEHWGRVWYYFLHTDGGVFDGFPLETDDESDAHGFSVRCIKK